MTMVSSSIRHVCILQHPNPKLPFEVKVAASEVGLGTVKNLKNPNRWNRWITDFVLSCPFVLQSCPLVLPAGLLETLLMPCHPWSHLAIFLTDLPDCFYTIYYSVFSAFWFFYIHVCTKGVAFNLIVHVYSDNQRHSILFYSVMKFLPPKYAQNSLSYSLLPISPFCGWRSPLMFQYFRVKMAKLRKYFSPHLYSLHMEAKKQPVLKS